MIVLYILGYFCRNKKNSYAALTFQKLKYAKVTESSESVSQIHSSKSDISQLKATQNEMKWIGLQARRTSWRWWDDWDDTVLQTQDSKFEAWRSEAEHATSRSRRLPTILTFTRGWGRNILFLSNRRDREPNPEPRTWKAAVLTTTLGPPPQKSDTIRLISLKNQYFSFLIIMPIWCKHIHQL